MGVAEAPGRTLSLQLERDGVVGDEQFSGQLHSADSTDSGSDVSAMGSEETGVPLRLTSIVLDLGASAAEAR